MMVPRARGSGGKDDGMEVAVASGQLGCKLMGHRLWSAIALGFVGSGCLIGELIRTVSTKVFCVREAVCGEVG